jgi:DnaK suppressor protein
MASVSHKVQNVDRARQEKLGQLLTRQGDALRNRRQILRASQPLAGVDLEETSLDAEEQGIGLSVLAITSETVRRIESALQRLQAGEFGTCAECGSPIGDARLRALPFAALCLGCQEKADNARAGAAKQAIAGRKSAAR